MKQKILFLALICLFGGSLMAQVSNEALLEEIKSLRNQVSNMRHQFDQVDKAIDDVIWYNKVGDVTRYIQPSPVLKYVTSPAHT